MADLPNGLDLIVVPGPRGASFIPGNGAPSAAIGKNSDTYLDLDTGDVWHRENGVWSKIASTIFGPVDPGQIEAMIASAAESVAGAVEARVKVDGTNISMNFKENADLADRTLSNLSDVQTALDNIGALAANGDADALQVAIPAAPSAKSDMPDWLTRDGCIDFRYFVGPTPAAGLAIGDYLQAAFDLAQTLPEDQRRIKMPAGNFTLDKAVNTGTGRKVGLVSTGACEIAVGYATGQGILVECQFFTLQNVRFRDPTGATGRWMFQYQRPGGNVDVDASIIDCEFINFNLVGNFYGRGLKICGNTKFASCIDSFKLYWPDTPSGADTDWQTGWRAIEAIGCRLHATTRLFQIMATDKGPRLQTSDNNSDVGRGFISGPCWHSSFKGDTLAGQTVVTFNITALGQGNVFAPAYCIGDATSPATRAISYGVGAVCEDVKISGLIQGYGFPGVGIEGNAKNLSSTAKFVDNGRLASAGAYDIDIGGDATGCDFGGSFIPNRTAGSLASGGACVRVGGVMDASSKFHGAKEASRTAVSGSVTDGALVNIENAVVRSPFAVAGQVPVLQIRSTKNGDATAGDSMAELQFYTADVSGGGAGVGGAMRMCSTTGTQAATFFEFSASTASFRDARRWRYDTSGLYPTNDNAYTSGNATNRWSEVAARLLNGEYQKFTTKTRQTLPTAVAGNTGYTAEVSNPEAGKSYLVRSDGSAWKYVGDQSAVSLV